MNIEEVEMRAARRRATAIGAVRRLCRNYTPTPPPIFQGPGLSERGEGYNHGSRDMAEAVLSTLSDLLDESGGVSGSASPGAGHAPVDVDRLRELAGALNRMHAKRPLANYTGFGDAILKAIGEEPGYMGLPLRIEDGAS